MNSKEKITVLSAWRNEALIAPFFLKHYFDIGVNEIHIILDDTTNDNTLEILKNHKKYKNNIKIHYINYPNGFCDEKKINEINEIYKSISEGWVVCCDADEFVFSKEYLKNVKLTKTLKQFEDNNTFILNSNMFQVFRHITETDLDINKKEKVILQRRYGLKVPITTDKIKIVDYAYKKPIVVKSNQKIYWSPGHHHLYNESGQIVKVEGEIMGVHWKYADPSFITYSTNNRLNNFAYIQRNIHRGMGHHWVETLEEAIKKCEENNNGILLF